MDYLIGWKEFKTKFNDDDVTMELLPLTVGSTIALAPAIDLITTIINDKKSSAAGMQNDMLKIQELSTPVLKDHVKDVNGFTINGENPTPEQLCSNPAFCTLVTNIITELIIRARLKGDEIKNSKGQSGVIARGNI